MIRFLTLPALITFLPSLTAGPAILINADKDAAPVPRRLFGVNLRQNMQETPAVRTFLKELGVTLFRYPDSLDQGYTWDWESGGGIYRESLTLG